MKFKNLFKRVFVFIFCTFMLLCFSSCNFAFSPFSILNTDENVENENKLYYVEEKSKFIDYDIEGDIIKFRYSIYFVNDTDETASFSVSADFYEKELENWIKIDAGVGCDEDGEMLRYEMKGKSEGDVVFTFTGKYLGGKVNENLSFPETLVILEH